MILALDTSGYSLFDSGHEAAVAAMEAASSLAISAIVLGELMAGFQNGNRVVKNRRRLDGFLDAFEVAVLPVTFATAPHYASVVGQLRSAGKPIPTNDIWIAACALEARAVLLTADRHFKNVKGLRLVELHPTAG